MPPNKRNLRSTPPAKTTPVSKKRSRQTALTEVDDDNTRAVMSRIAELEQRLAAATTNNPAPLVSAPPAPRSGPTQDEVNDMRSRGREVLEKYMKEGKIKSGDTSSLLKDGVLPQLLNEIMAATPNVPRRQVSMYITTRLAYIKNTKTTEGRWKQKFTETNPEGYFCRYEGPAKGYRIFGRSDHLITPEETQTILEYQAAGRPKEGPLHEKFTSINGCTKDSIPDDEVEEDEKVLVKKEVQKEEKPAVRFLTVPFLWNNRSQALE